MPTGFKTHFLNKIRKLYANPFGEYWLLRFVQGKASSDFVSRFIPMPHLFPKPSWRLVVRNGIKMNLDISDLVDWYAYFNLKDNALDFVLSIIKPDDVIIDVGANIGYVSLRYAQKASRGFVYGMEPSSYNFSKCRANIALNSQGNLMVQNIALAETEGFLNLQTVTPHNSGMNRIVPASISNSEKIYAKTLDQIVREYNLGKIDLIKLDVEGYEMSVLKGGIKTIQTFRPKLFIEVNDGFLKEFNSSSSLLYQWLMGNHYNLYHLNNKKINKAAEISNRHLDILAVPVEENKNF